MFRKIAACFAACLTLGWIATAASAAEPRVSFPQSILPIPAPVAATAHLILAANQGVQQEFGVSFRMRNFAQMQERIGRGEIISRAELESNYLPLQSDYDAVVSWLVGQGFTITQNDPSRLVVYAKGTLAQIQTSLEVHMVTVTANGGNTYHAADTAPSLPLSVATPVLGINHLQPYLQARKHAIVNPLTNNAPPFKINEILKVYSATNLGVTGAGQKIAILIDTFAKNSDLTSFWTANSVAQSLGNIEQVNVNGGTLPSPSGEETLDEEWTSGIAPGAKVRVYASKTLAFSDLDKCLQRLINDLPTQSQIHQLSISLGLGETYMSPGQFTTDAQFFAAIASQGVSIFVSSGDGSSTPDVFGGNSGPLQVEYFASDPSVTAVGGTSLTVNANTGLRTTEKAWNGSGGGVSIQFARPSWQTGRGVPTGSKRFVPPTGLAADPGTGAYVYLGGVQQIGGTSWSAPTWAGFCALINESRAKAGKAPLGLLNPRLYPLIGTANFFDVTTGNNATSTSGGKYAAATGFDEVTGIGAPHVGNLMSTLGNVQANAPTIVSFTPTSGVQNTTVVITGTNFSSVSAVRFNGTSAAFIVNSSTQITALSPAGATTGPISVTTAGGTATSAINFIVLTGPPAPSLTGFSPAYGAAGTNVNIIGANLTGATAVRFNGTAAAFNVVASSVVTATVPVTATTGLISVTTQSGTAISGSPFTVLTGNGSPTVASFTPSSGTANTTVTITGTNFVNVIGVTIGGVAVAAPTVNSDTQITALVPAGAVTGPIVVTTGLGIGTSATNFTVNAAPVSPVLISQIYGGGGNSGAVYQNDYIELYNRSGSPVTLTGWSVQYAASTGTSWSVIPLSGVIQSGNYYLIKGASGGAVGAVLPTADATDITANLGQTAGKVVLLNASTAIPPGTSSPIGLSSFQDFAGYGAADAYEGTGPAPSISATTADFRANSGATDTDDNSADFTAATPNPRNSGSGGGSSAPDLAIAKSHTGNFMRGDTGKAYTITVSNAGTLDTTGTVSVTDILPAGLTATAFSGPGWTTNLFPLTASRSEVLSPGASYPPLTLTVDVGATATSGTNVATVAGGGETNTTNDTANDPTTITSGVPTVLASWDVSKQSNFGTSPLPATTADPGLTVGGLTRGSGVGITGTGAARGWGGTSFTNISTYTAVIGHDFATCDFTPKTGFTVSFTSVSKFDYRRALAGPSDGVLQYQVGNSDFTDVAALSYPSTSTTGASLGPIDLGSISALQNIPAGTKVTFRIVNFNGTASGAWYIYDVSKSTAADFAISGVVSAIPGGGIVKAEAAPDNSASVVQSQNLGVGSSSAALLAGMTSADTGSVGIAGSATQSGGTYTVTGSGADISGTADGFQYVSRSLSGDGEIRARVTSQTNSNVGAKAGVMLRDTTAAGSADAALTITPGNGFAFLYRATAGGPTSTIAGPPLNTAPNNWVRLVRSGTLVTGYVSADGNAWSQVGSAVVNMGASASTGLAVTSHDNSQTSTATFDNLAVTPFPSPWQTVDIGSADKQGSAEYFDSTFTEKGAGIMGTTTDGLRFAYQSLSGDGEIRARMPAPGNTGSNMRLGVMIRNDLTSGSAYAFAGITGDSHFSWQSRALSGSGIVAQSGEIAKAPDIWLRLVRSGSKFTAYESTDGATWTQIGTKSITMGTNIYIGLIDSSGSKTILNTTVFDNVLVVP